MSPLDPGASAYPSGYGPVRRYLDFLRQQGYPVTNVKFFPMQAQVSFGGDGESWAHWAVELPMCGNHGRAQVFLLAGETPLLCGRPIIEALRITMDFEKKQIKLRNGPWRPATIGLHGEYLLGLWDPAEPVDWSKPLPLQFDLQLAPDDDLDPRPTNRNLPSSLWMTTSRPRPMPMVNYLFHVIYFDLRLDHLRGPQRAPRLCDLRTSC